jgi:RNA polymerase sigma factor (sigma-70 family)
MNQKELIRKCKKGNRKAQNALYKHCHRQVMGICIRYTDTTEEAEDCFQESFVKLFRDIGKLNDAQAFWAWMKSLVVRTCIDHNRKKIVKIDSIETNYTLLNNDYESIFDKMETQEILKVLNALPIGYKTIFNLHVIEGYSHREIGELLKISEGTSKSQLSKAKVMVSQALFKITGLKAYEKIS